MSLKTYEDLIGLEKVTKYVHNQIQSNNLRQFTIFYGMQGSGKTTLSRLMAVDICGDFSLSPKISRGESTEAIKLFNMSTFSDDNIDVIISSLKPSMTDNHRRVVILDEAHNITRKAQDKLLEICEVLPEGVYLFLLTTNISSLVSPLIDRAFLLPFRGLSISDKYNLIRKLLKENNIVETDNLKYIIPSIVRNYNTARQITNLIESFRDKGTIDFDEYKLITSDNEEYLYGLLTLLDNSPLLGVEYIETNIVPPSIKQDILEYMKVLLGSSTYSLSSKIVNKLKELGSQPVKRIKYVSFLNNILKYDKIDKYKVTVEFLYINRNYDMTDETVIKRYQNQGTELSNWDLEEKSMSIMEMLKGMQDTFTN